METELEARIRLFAAWLVLNVRDPQPSDDMAALADAMAAAVMMVDAALGVEVCALPSGGYEAIVTAYSEPQVFDVVRALVAALPRIPGWNFVALKQARGFDFSVAVGDTELRASELRVVKLTDVANGFVLMVPSLQSIAGLTESDRKELAWLIVETGLGEAASSRVQHLEFASLEVAHDTTTHDILELERLLEDVF